MLRTVTLATVWRVCVSASACAGSTALRRSHSRTSAYCRVSAWCRRWWSCARKACRTPRSSVLAAARAIVAGRATRPCRSRCRRAGARLVGGDALGDAAQVLDQDGAKRGRQRPQLADLELVPSWYAATKRRRRPRSKSLSVWATLGPRDAVDAGQARAAAPTRAWVACGSSRAAGRRGSRAAALRRGGSCRAATRRRGSRPARRGKYDPIQAMDTAQGPARCG
jgi:hypothetical protein